MTQQRGNSITKRSVPTWMMEINVESLTRIMSSPQEKLQTSSSGSKTQKCCSGTTNRGEHHREAWIKQNNGSTMNIFLTEHSPLTYQDQPPMGLSRWQQITIEPNTRNTRVSDQVIRKQKTIRKETVRRDETQSWREDQIHFKIE